MTETATPASLLADLQQRTGWSSGQIAQRLRKNYHCQVSASSVRDWLNGHCEPRAESYINIVKLLKATKQRE
jgi:hypothetical protein